MTITRFRRLRTAMTCLAILTSGLTAGLMFACEKKPNASASPTAASAASDPASVYRSVHAALGSTLLERVALGQPSDADLAAKAAEIDRLVAASKASPCDFGVDFSDGLATMLPHVEQQRALARVLKADAARLLAAGDKDGAAKRTAAIFRVASQVGQSAKTIIELLGAFTIAQLASEFVEQSPTLAQAAWKTGIQQAITETERTTVGRGGEVIASEGQMIVEWLRTSSDAASTKLGLKSRTPEERAAAAKALEPLFAESSKAWSQSGAKAKFTALASQAQKEGVQDLFPKLDGVRNAADLTKAALAKAHAALMK